MIIGIGVDTVDIARFERQLARTPALRERLFTPRESGLPTHSLAARFAAKEALIKALGGSAELRWHDLEVVRNGDRTPSFVATPRLTQTLAALGADRVHLSMTHDAGLATAFVIVESSGSAASAAVPAARGTLAAGSGSGSGSGAGSGPGAGSGSGPGSGAEAGTQDGTGQV